MSKRAGFDLQIGMDLTALSIGEIWWRYAAVGGRADLAVLQNRIAGTVAFDAREHDLIAQVLNECLLDQGIMSFPVAYLGVDEPRRAVRERARDARRRCAEIAAKSAELHVRAARLMDDCGNLSAAQRTRQRAAGAPERADAVRRDSAVA